MKKKLLLFLCSFCVVYSVAFAAPPAAPTQASLLVTNTSLVDGLQVPANVRVSWQDNSTNEAGFTISFFYGVPTSGVATPVKTVGVLSNVTSLETTLIGSSTNVYAEVRSYANSEASSPSRTNSASLGVAPVAPSDIKAVLSVDNTTSYSPSFKGTVTWKDNAANEVGYTITPYYVINGTYKQVSQYMSWFASANSNSIAITPMSYQTIPATTTPLVFVVNAFNPFGNTSATSTPESFASAPAAPSNITVVAGDMTIPAYYGAPSYVPVTVSWKDNATNETGYTVMASYGTNQVSANSPFVTIPYCNAPANATSCTFPTNDPIKSVLATTTPVSFTVSANNQMGSSQAVSSYQVLASAPAAPSSVVASVTPVTSGNATVKVVWTGVASSTKVSVSFFYVNGVAVTNNGVYPYCPVSGSSCTVTLPATTTQMYVTVSASNSVGVSQATRSSLFSTQAVSTTQPGVIAPVTAVSGYSYQTTSVMSRRKTYKVYVSFTGGDSSLMSKINRYVVSGGQQKLQYSWLIQSGLSSFTDTAVTSGSQYVYEVTKVNGTQSSKSVKSSIITIPGL